MSGSPLPAPGPIVSAWIVSDLHNSIISRDTQIINFLTMTALPHLVQILSASPEPDPGTTVAAWIISDLYDTAAAESDLFAYLTITALPHLVSLLDGGS